ncbi:MAG TPA: aspartyl protease family protein [Candidatus Saccharimonadaceae bacterium]|jgi:hypothetical protein|nr:aspartyl protease family protein [Candidatus Saccharimonadaceae bacterium]
MIRSTRRTLAALVVLLAFAPPARATITPAAQATLDRYVAAMGGRARVTAVTSTHIKASMSAFGFKGQLETWSQSPDKNGGLTALGPFNLKVGFDGTTAWRTDPGGKLQVLDGKELDRARADAWFENERFLEPDQGGGDVKDFGTVKDSTGEHHDLEITPPVGPSRRYELDPKTWLPRRSTSHNDQNLVITTFADYRAVEGLQMPFHTTTSIAGMPANTLTVDLDSVWVNVPVDPMRFAVPAAQDAAVTYLKQPGVAHLPFAYRGRHVWLRASVNGGPPADFLFDTGASISVIDSAYAASIGLKTEGAMQATGAGSAGSASFAHLQSLRVVSDDGDGVELKDHKVAVLSVNPFLAPFFWRDCAGVIGYNFISQFVDEIDYDGHVLALYDPKTFHYTGPGKSMTFEMAGTVPAILMTVDDSLSGVCRLDVGSSSTLDLHGPFVRKHALDKSTDKGIDVMGGGFGGMFSSKLVRMHKLAIGEFSWAKPLVTLSGATSGALASEDYAGNAGNGLMERFKLTIDYDRHTLYLEPGKKFATPYEFSRAGVQFAKSGGVVRAMQVLKGSPAEKAGIKEGDELVELNGKPAGTYDPDQIADLLEHGDAGTKVPVVVSRDGKQKSVKVVLKDLL